jgi:TPP-dependent pyruvate/acetoin dehydrogenase alpha subunit
MTDVNTKLRIYRKLYKARAAEDAVLRYYGEDEMKTPMHMSYGQEHCPVGVCSALATEDVVFGTYRSHALYLSKTENLRKFFGEMYGKIIGMVDGKGGSMHMSDPPNGFMGSSAIVGSMIPVAIGAGFAFKYKNQPNISVPFFGDGAIDEADFWESVNIATSKRLPVLFVLENNNWAVHTSPKVRQGYSSITNVMRQFDFCSVLELDGLKFPDAELIYSAATSLKQCILDSQKPAFIEIHLNRELEHVGVGSDYGAGYRQKPDAEDCVSFLRKKFITNGIPEESIVKLEKQIFLEVESAISESKAAPFPDDSKLYEGVFV